MFSFFRKSKTWKQYFDEGIAYGQAGDSANAEPSFREAIRLAPSEPYPHYELGYTLFLMERYKEALEELRRTNELARGFFLVQTEAYMCEQFHAGVINAEALKLLRLLQQLTDSGASHSDQAVTVSRRVIELAPECALGYFHLGKALLENDPVAAERALVHCVEMHPDDTTAIDAKFHFGLLRQQAGQEVEARRIWQGIVADYPGNPHTKFAEMSASQELA